MSLPIIQVSDLFGRPFLDFKGKLYVLTGPMRSGKTANLVHIAKTIRPNQYEEKFEDLSVKPASDIRLHNHIRESGLDPLHIFTSKGGLVLPGVMPYENIDDLVQKYERSVETAIDRFGQQGVMMFGEEFQFSHPDLTLVLEKILSDGYTGIVLSGLTMGFRKEPWSKMTEKILGMADKVIYLTAQCELKHDGCNAASTVSQRLTYGNPSHWAEPLAIVENGEGISVVEYKPGCVSCGKWPGKEVADDMRDLIISEREIPVPEIYFKMDKLHDPKEVRLVLYRMQEENAVVIEDLERGDSISNFGDLGKRILSLQEDKIPLGVIKKGNVTYQGILDYRVK